MADSMSLCDPMDLVEDAGCVIVETPFRGGLTKAQGLALLARLVRDEGFRGTFEQGPSSALLELGIPAEQIATLRPACLTRRRLAPAAELEVARRKLETDLEAQTLIFVVPDAKI